MSIKRVYSNADFGDARLPMAVSDDMVTGGTMFRADFSNTDCLVGTDGSSDGNIIDFSSIGETNERWVPGGSNPLYPKIGDGLKMDNSNGGNASGLQQFVDDGYALNDRNDHTLALGTWVYFNGAFNNDTQTSNILSISEGNATATSAGFALRAGKSAEIPGITISVLAAGYFFAADVSATEPQHIAAIIERGAVNDTLTAYLNGEEVGTRQIAHVDWAAMTASAVKLWGIYSAGALTIYSAMVEDCTLSGRDPEQWILQDYANHIDGSGDPTWL